MEHWIRLPSERHSIHPVVRLSALCFAHFLSVYFVLYPALCHPSGVGCRSVSVANKPACVLTFNANQFFTFFAAAVIDLPIAALVNFSLNDRNWLQSDGHGQPMEFGLLVSISLSMMCTLNVNNWVDSGWVSGNELWLLAADLNGARNELDQACDCCGQASNCNEVWHPVIELRRFGLTCHLFAVSHLIPRIRPVCITAGN